MKKVFSSVASLRHNMDKLNKNNLDELIEFLSDEQTAQPVIVHPTFAPGGTLYKTREKILSGKSFDLSNSKVKE